MVTELKVKYLLLHHIFFNEAIDDSVSIWIVNLIGIEYNLLALFFTEMSLFAKILQD